MWRFLNKLIHDSALTIRRKGGEWSVSARGPLAVLGIVLLLALIVLVSTELRSTLFGT